MVPRKPQRRGPSPALIISLFVTTTLALPLALWLIPDIRRHLMLDGLTSADLPTRERALSYLVHRARFDDRLRDGALALLATSDEQNFVQLVNALDQAGCWKIPPVPLPAYLRWLRLVLDDPNPSARISALQTLAELSEHADDPALLDLLTELANSTDADVRYNAVYILAELASAAGHTEPYRQLLEQRSADGQPTIAAAAIRLATWLEGDANPTRESWPTLAELLPLPPEVAQARLWRAARRQPQHAEGLLTLLHNEQTPAALRLRVVSLLGQSTDPQAASALAELLRQPPPDDATLLLQWRALLSLARLNDHRTPPAWLIALAPQAELEPRWRPLLAAAAYQSGCLQLLGATPTAPTPPAAHDTTDTLDLAPRWDWLLRLALLESPAPLPIQPPIYPSDPDLLRLPSLARQPGAGVDLWPNLLSVDSAPRRDLGCLLAAAALDKSQQEALVERLLHSYDDRSRFAGALLAGLTGHGAVALEKRAADETNWMMRQMLRISLWMQGREVLEQDQPLDMPQLMENLLTRGDAPATSVLLAMLQRGDARALRWLLDPRREFIEIDPAAIHARVDAAAPVTLRDLLVDGRWWLVLRNYLPAEAPTLDLWADMPEQQFQVDLLRDWYAAHRHQAQVVAPRAGHD